MKYHRNCSASDMFVFNGVPSFIDMWCKYIYGFKQRLTNSDNAIVAATVSACRFLPIFWNAGIVFYSLYTDPDSYQ